MRTMLDRTTLPSGDAPMRRCSRRTAPAISRGPTPMPTLSATGFPRRGARCIGRWPTGSAMLQRHNNPQATVRNDVAQVKGASALPISMGENVVRKEVVRTGADSSTKLVFADSTNLAVGPVSTVTLDRFVFARDGNYRDATVNLVRGAFRFSTGSSDKRAYKINTLVATIGVRGTELDILSERARTVATLNEGQAIVCTRTGGKLSDLVEPGR